MSFFRTIIIVIYFLSVLCFTGFFSFYHYLCHFFCHVENTLHESFDYIIVGSGSAGSLIAQRLSADKNVTVLVLEAGKDSVSLLKIPSVGLMLQQTPYDWQYSTVPQYNACLGLSDNVSRWPMGKIVGGTGMLNNMLHVKGHQTDFDDWFKSKKDYSFSQDVMPYFRKMEAFADDNSNPYGVVYLSDPNYLTILPEYIKHAAETLGLFGLEDVADSRIGTGVPKVYLKKGERWTSASKLKIVDKPNLVLKTDSLVEKIVFEGDFEATGVIYQHCQKRHFVRAKRGVILSAGVIGSPKILMLSGIGPKHHLSQIGIKAKVDLPVGDNLQDHVTTGLDLVLLNTTLNLHIEDILSPISAFKYFAKGTGPWTTAGCELLLYSMQNMSQNTEDLRPDLQFMVMPLAIKEDEGIYLRKLMGISDESWNRYFALTKTQAVTILPVLLHPKSKGMLRLAGKNVYSKPLIDPKYLSDPKDVEMLVGGIQIIKKLVQSEEMQKLGAKINDRLFPGCEAFKFDTKEYWECYVRYLTITSYHPIGTCRMGSANDPSSVVNYKFQGLSQVKEGICTNLLTIIQNHLIEYFLRNKDIIINHHGWCPVLRGFSQLKDRHFFRLLFGNFHIPPNKVKHTNKLYVSDGSVLPSLTSGNINAAILLMAEMASDKIRESYFLDTGKCNIVDRLMSKNQCLQF